MIPTRSRDSWTRSVNSGRAVTHVVEPRRVARQLAKKYRDAAAWESECRFAGAGGGTPVGSGNLHNKLSVPLWHRLREVSSSMRTSLSTLQGSRPRCARCARVTRLGGRSCGVPARARSLRGRAPRAFSSVGESARLITVRSLVRIQKGPRPSPHLDGRLSSAWGRSSAGRAPALQAGGRRFEPGRLHILDHSPPSPRRQPAH